MQQQNQNNGENNIVRSIVRGAYDIQKLRIMMGNRIAANFRYKLGQEPGETDKDMEEQNKKILVRLKESYARITDAIVIEGANIEGKLPTPRKFVGDELISSYTELVLVDEYMSLVRNEEQHFKRLGRVLETIPIYTEFLQHVKGIGPAMAGVIVSEINIHRAQYPSSLWMYAGLDCVTVGVYTDDNGKEHTKSIYDIDAEFDSRNPGTMFYAEGKYPVEVRTIGRNRRDYCLVQREYQTREGETAFRNSITFNPFLKTKLLGVLGPSFLRAGGSVAVDGKKLGAAKRLELAKSKGFAMSNLNEEDEDTAVITFLKMLGCEIVEESSPYNRAYYDYKNRIERDPRHAEKTPAHRHNMAIRFAVKRFLVDCYAAWRKLEGLPVSTEYSEGKLGMIHKMA